VVHPKERVRTFGAAVKRIAELTNTHSDAARVGVLHGDNPTSAAELAKTLGERFPEMRIETGEIGAVLGVHGGPGVVGAAVLLRT
jgi:fatty acid-binding protein DegV